MNVPRETVFQALFERIAFAKIGADPAFVTTSRKFRWWTEVPEAMQPALYQQQEDQRASSDKNYGETLWGLRAIWWIYCQHSPDDEVVPSTMMNGLMDAVETALLPDPSGRQTLGGLVEHCYIDGDVVWDEGLVPSDIQSVIRVPILIRTGV